MRVTVFGLGEAGSLIASDLARAGAEVHGYDPADVPTPDGVIRHDNPDTAVEGARFVLAVTAAVDAGEALTQAANAMAANTVYADLSTAAPGLKAELAGEADTYGLVFADVALMSTVPGSGLATYALVSGPGATQYAEFVNDMGGDVEVVGESPGEAAARKLLRSVVAKGLTVLLMESLEAARAHGDAEWIWTHLVELITDADEALLIRLIEGTPQHIERRIVEMDAARAFLESLGVEPTMTAATAETLRRLRSR